MHNIRKRTKHQYFDKVKVTDALNEHYRQKLQAIEDGSQIPPLPPIVGEAILNIATRYAYSPKFKRAYNKDELISTGVLSAMEATLKNYDPTLSKTKNCFSFLTQAVFFGFLGHFAGEKRVMRQKNLFLELLLDGQASIGNQTIGQYGSTQLKDLRKIVDQYALDNAKGDK